MRLTRTALLYRYWCGEGWLPITPFLWTFRSNRRPMRCSILGRLWIAFMTPRLLSKSQVMSHKQQTTIFGIVFWTLLLASVGLVDRYQWLQPVWAVVCIGFLVVGAVSSTVDMYRNRRYSNGRDCLPRWMMWVVLDDEQYDKYLQRRRLTTPDKKAY
jgi:hypothetical protein